MNCGVLQLHVDVETQLLLYEFGHFQFFELEINAKRILYRLIHVLNHFTNLLKRKYQQFLIQFFCFLVFHCSVK